MKAYYWVVIKSFKMASIDKYALEQVELGSEWDDFILSSSFGTPFSLSYFLNSLARPIHCYFCKKSDEIVAGVVLILSEDGSKVTGHGLAVFDGIIYREFSALNLAQRNSEQFKAQQFIGETLITKYSCLRMTLNPLVKDIRAFSWVNYNTEFEKFRVQVNYSSQVDLREFRVEKQLNEYTLYQSASVSRRQEIRYGYKKGVEIELSKDYGSFIEFYRMTMNRQNCEVSDTDAIVLSNLLSTLDAHKSIKMYKAVEHTGRVGSYAVFLLGHNKVVYYLLGANDPQMRNSHTGTAVIWQSLPVLASEGMDILDLEGINSPQRGWFKLSFGGNIIPYYRLDYNSKG